MTSDSGGSTKAVLRGVGTLGAGTAVAAILGVGLQALIGYHFGASLATDAYFMSLSIIAFLAKALMLGHFKAIGLPEYLRLKDTDPEAARALLGSLLRWGGLCTVALCAVVLLAAPVLVSALAPAYTGEQRELTIRLLRIRTPALFFLITTAVGLIALETRHRFGWSITLEKVVPAAVTVGLLALLGPTFGVEGLGWMGLAGAVASGVAMVAIAFRVGSQKAGPTDVLRKIGGAWVRFGWSNAATSGAEWVYRIAASLLAPGLFTAVVFGRMVHDMLHSALNDAARTVALPRFARAATVGTSDDPAGDLGAALGVALESLTAVALPIAVMVACLSPWITAVLFGQGEFLASGRLGATAIAMAVFMIGFVVQGRNQLCFQVAFATGRSGIVNRVQIIGHVIRAILLMPFVWAWSFVGLVLAQVTMNVVVAAAFWALSPRDWAHNHRPIRGGAFRGVGAALPVAAVPFGAFLLLRAWLPDPLALAPLTRIGMLLLMTLGWLALGLLVAFVVRLPALMRLLPRNRSAA